MQHLHDKVAVITGGAGGIGLGIAHAFLDAGMRVVLSDIDEKRLASTVNHLQGAGADVLGIPADVAKQSDVDALAAATMQQRGGVQVLCNNAGLPVPRSVREVSQDDWDRGLGVNLFGVIHGIQAFMPIMEEQGEGHISATSSMSGLVAFPPVVVYNIAKFGVIAIMETFARELRGTESPIEASVFCPGEVATHAIDNGMINAANAGLEATPEEIEAAKRAQAGLLDEGMDPDQVGRAVLDGIREGRFWIFSHPNWIDQFIRPRFEAMAADGSLPDL